MYAVTLGLCMLAAFPDSGPTCDCVVSAKPLVRESLVVAEMLRSLVRLDLAFTIAHGRGTEAIYRPPDFLNLSAPQHPHLSTLSLPFVSLSLPFSTLLYPFCTLSTFLSPSLPFLSLSLTLSSLSQPFSTLSLPLLGLPQPAIYSSLCIRDLNPRKCFYQ